MTPEAFLADVMRDDKFWIPDGPVTFTRERAYSTFEFADAGVGEDYVVDALRARYPGLEFEVETEGGCRSCGFGRTVTITCPADFAPELTP